VRKAIAFLLYNLCTVLDRIPRYTDGRWYGWGDWGCSLGISLRASKFDDDLEVDAK
jgi:hypothetical protein